MTTTDGYPQLRRSRPPGAAELLLVRHGETMPYVPGAPFDVIDCGTGDPPLAPTGHEGATQVGERLAHEPIAGVYITPLQRTLQTAAPLLERTGLEPVVVPELKEVYLGEWDRGRSREHFANDHPIAVQARTLGRWDVIPGAESSAEFASRVTRGIEFIAARHRDELAVAFVHGGVISEVLHQAIGVRPFTLSIDNASITHIFVTPERWVVRTVNDVAHRPHSFASPANSDPSVTDR